MNSAMPPSLRVGYCAAESPPYGQHRPAPASSPCSSPVVATPTRDPRPRSARRGPASGDGRVPVLVARLGPGRPGVVGALGTCRIRLVGDARLDLVERVRPRDLGAQDLLERPLPEGEVEPDVLGLDLDRGPLPVPVGPVRD